MNMHTPDKAMKNLRKLQDVRDMIMTLDAQLVQDIVRMNDSRPVSKIINWAKYSDELIRIANAIKRADR